MLRVCRNRRRVFVVQQGPYFPIMTSLEKLGDTRFKCPECDVMRGGWELYPGQTTINGQRITIRLCNTCRYVCTDEGPIYQTRMVKNYCWVADPDSACKFVAPLFVKPEPVVVTKTKTVTKSVPCSSLKVLFDELLVAPDEQTFTYRDRIVLVSNDGVEFFTHASVVSRDSPTLRAFYHGKYDDSPVVTRGRGRVAADSKYRSFKLEEADRQTVEQMLRFIYLDELPPASAQLGPLIRVCHFLQIERFMSSLVHIIKKAVNEKTLTSADSWELQPYLTKYECREAFEALVKGNVQ